MKRFLVKLGVIMAVVLLGLYGLARGYRQSEMSLNNCVLLGRVAICSESDWLHNGQTFYIRQSLTKNQWKFLEAKAEAEWKKNEPARLQAEKEQEERFAGLWAKSQAEVEAMMKE